MRKTLLLLVLASVSALLVVACSSNSSTPIEPDPGGDLIAPTSPANLLVEVQGNTVHLSWRENHESDLAGYVIYRETGQSGFQSLSAVPSAGYYDRIEAEGPMIVEYKVSALDQSGNESGYSSSVTVNLYTYDPEVTDPKGNMGTGN
jgi:fibronectin type 3 domain-containing protein